MVLNGKLDPRDSTHPANRRAQQVKMHTLTDFQLYVQNMGSSVINHGNPGERQQTQRRCTIDKVRFVCLI